MHTRKLCHLQTIMADAAASAQVAGESFSYASSDGEDEKNDEQPKPAAARVSPKSATAVPQTAGVYTIVCLLVCLYSFDYIFVFV